MNYRVSTYSSQKGYGQKNTEVSYGVEQPRLFLFLPTAMKIQTRKYSMKSKSTVFQLLKHTLPLRENISLQK